VSLRGWRSIFLLCRVSLSHTHYSYQFHIKISFSIFCSIPNDLEEIFKVIKSHWEQSYLQYTYVSRVHVVYMFIRTIYLYIYCIFIKISFPIFLLDCKWPVRNIQGHPRSLPRRPRWMRSVLSLIYHTSLVHIVYTFIKITIFFSIFYQIPNDLGETSKVIQGHCRVSLHHRRPRGLKAAPDVLFVTKWSEIGNEEPLADTVRYLPSPTFDLPLYTATQEPHVEHAGAATAN